MTFAFGALSETTLQTIPVTFRPDKIMFYGFNGRTQGSYGQLRGLGIIGYDAPCVDQFKADMGDKFSWKKEPEQETFVP